MLRHALAVAVPALAALACGSGNDRGADGALEERLVAVLEAEGDAVDGDLTGADVTCPDVGEPSAGDRATCTLRFDGDRQVQVDVEFDADGSIAVVAVVPG